MTLCPFTAFLRTPFTNADFLHYLLKYTFEKVEERIWKQPLQRVPRKSRLRFQGMILFKKKK